MAKKPINIAGLEPVLSHTEKKSCMYSIVLQTIFANTKIKIITKLALNLKFVFEYPRKSVNNTMQ